MAVSDLTLILEVACCITLVFIVLLSILSVYWHVQFLFMTQWSYYSPLKLLTAVVSFLFTIVFGYMLFDYIVMGNVNPSFFGTMFIRPVILLQASISAATGRARVVIAQKGGEHWISRRTKGEI